MVMVVASHYLASKKVKGGRFDHELTYWGKNAKTLKTPINSPLQYEDNKADFLPRFVVSISEIIHCETKIL